MSTFQLIIYGNTEVVTERFIAKDQNIRKDFNFSERESRLFIKRIEKRQMISKHTSEKNKIEI